MNTNTTNTNNIFPHENINQLLFQLQNPQIYTGREIHAVRKVPAPHMVRICLVFPDTYEIGMSHHGLTLLYHLLNQRENVMAERCFLPVKASIPTFKNARVPLFSLETKTLLKDFDLISFSLLSEMTFTNILQVLDMAGIPLLSRDRQSLFPLVAAGGISAVNPEPLRPFFDFFGFGDGEVLFPDIIAAMTQAKRENMNRHALLELMATIDGVYVPLLHPPIQYGRFYGPAIETGKIKKRILSHLADYPPQNRLIMPLGNVVFNRLNVEIARGCYQGCRFCQARSYYAPYRSRSLETNIAHIHHGLQETGFDTFSLSTLSAGDYPQLKPLLQLIPQVIAPAVSFSLSSMRPATLSDHLLSTMALYKRTGITIVPEAGTQRLRDAIGKDVSQDEINQAVELALKNRWQKIKLYFMIGLPTETMEDIQGIVDTIRDILTMAQKAKQKINIHASFSSFVPKPQTPLQWAQRDPLSSLHEKIAYLRNTLPAKRSLNLDIHSPKTGVVETILARGDVRVSQLLLDAFSYGEIFSAWDQEFHFPTWERLINDGQFQPFLEEFPLDEPLPWDFLQVNYHKKHLQDEYNHALKGIPVHSCLTTACNTCAGCLFKLTPPTVSAPDIDLILAQIQVKEPLANTPEPAYNQVRLFYRKCDDFIFFSQITMLKHIERLIRKTRIRFKFTQGFTPRMKISSLPPLPVYATGLEEAVEVWLDAALSENEILHALNQCAEPEGLHFYNVMICNQAPSLTHDIEFVDLEIQGDFSNSLLETLSQHLGDRDTAHLASGRLVLHIDYSTQGQERFAKIYKLIDPDKKATRFLTRTHVSFKHCPITTQLPQSTCST